MSEKLKNKWLYIRIDGATQHRHIKVAINARYVDDNGFNKTVTLSVKV